MPKLAYLPLAVLFLATLACGSFSPPESCGDSIGGTADEALFGENFASMDLVSEDTWQPGTPGEQGVTFNEEALLIMFDAKHGVSIRACIQETRGGGKIAFDETHTFSSGSGEFQVGSFTSGNYVIRVIVDGILVKNFPFQITK